VTLDTIDKEHGFVSELKQSASFAAKIIAHIFIDLIVIISVIIGFYILKYILFVLGMGNDEFINTLIKYSESATLVVYIAFAGISIIGVLKKEVMLKFITPILEKRDGANKE
jgi:hypothetical protein